MWNRKILSDTKWRPCPQQTTTVKCRPIVANTSPITHHLSAIISETKKSNYKSRLLHSSQLQVVCFLHMLPGGTTIEVTQLDRIGPLVYTLVISSSLFEDHFLVNIFIAFHDLISVSLVCNSDVLPKWHDVLWLFS